MKRRGFFGLMGGAVVAGPSMAQQAISTGLEGLSIGGVGRPFMDGGAGYAVQALADGPSETYDPTHWPRKELADFLGRTAEEWAQIRLDTYVASLDPDIAIMRSISLTSKIRMQRDRNFERNRATTHRSLTAQLADAIKRFTS